MTTPDREAVEMFLQEAAEHLQYLREYVSVLQEVSPRREDLERLYISAHTLSGTSASYGFPRFSEVAGKLAHIFQYALQAPLGDDLHGPLTEFLSDAISLLEGRRKLKETLEEQKAGRRAILEQLRGGWEELAFEQQQSLLRELIERVTVLDEGSIVTLRS